MKELEPTLKEYLDQRLKVEFAVRNLQRMLNLLEERTALISQLREYLESSNFCVPYYIMIGGVPFSGGRMFYDFGDRKKLSLSAALYTFVSTSFSVVIDSKGEIVLSKLPVVPSEIEMPIKVGNLFVSKSDQIEYLGDELPLRMGVTVEQALSTKGLVVIEDTALILAAITGDDFHANVDFINSLCSIRSE